MMKMIEKSGSAKKLDSGPFMRNPIEPNLLDRTRQTKPIKPAQTKYKPIKAHFFLRGARLFSIEAHASMPPAAKKNKINK